MIHPLGWVCLVQKVDTIDVKDKTIQLFKEIHMASSSQKAFDLNAQIKPNHHNALIFDLDGTLLALPGNVSHFYKTWANESFKDHDKIIKILGDDLFQTLKEKHKQPLTFSRIQANSALSPQVKEQVFNKLIRWDIVKQIKQAHKESKQSDETRVEFHLVTKSSLGTAKVFVKQAGLEDIFPDTNISDSRTNKANPSFDYKAMFKDYRQWQLADVYENNLQNRADNSKLHMCVFDNSNWQAIEELFDKKIKHQGESVLTMIGVEAIGKTFTEKKQVTVNGIEHAKPTFFSVSNDDAIGSSNHASFFQASPSQTSEKDDSATLTFG